MAPRTGRPPSENPRSKMVTARFTEAENDLIASAAALDGLTPGLWMHDRLVADAKRAHARHMRGTRRTPAGPAAADDR